MELKIAGFPSHFILEEYIWPTNHLADAARERDGQVLVPAILVLHSSSAAIFDENSSKIYINSVS